MNSLPHIVIDMRCTALTAPYRIRLSSVTMAEVINLLAKPSLTLSQGMAEFSLFPGQIILVFGTNSSGRKMLAQRIIEGVQAPLPSTSPKRLLELHHSSHYQGGASSSFSFSIAYYLFFIS